MKTDPQDTPGSKRITKAQFLRWLFTPVDISGMVVFRVAFGIVIACYALKQLTSGNIEFHYTGPLFHFPYLGFEWVKPWSTEGMFLHFIALALAGLGVALGLFYRLSAAALFVLFTYVFLLDRTLYNNHYYLICILAAFLNFIPLHKSFSLDALVRPRLRSQTLPAWTLYLLRFQFGVVYFYGGLAKLNYDWIHGFPVKMWLAADTSYPVIGQWFTENWMVQLIVWGGILIDLSAVPLLLWRRSRPFMFALTLVFHITNSTLFKIGVFPWMMIFATTLFFPSNWPRRVLRMRDPAQEKSFDASRLNLSALQKCGVSLLMLFVALQLLIPFRHHLYPGDASWTEEGHQFAWRMMLRDKKCGIRFYAHNNKTGRAGIIDIKPFINPLQASKLSRSPDMITQFCQFLSEEFKRRGLGDTEIRVVVLASLNGRKPQLLIDPKVNMVTQQRGLHHYPWILPLEEELREDPWKMPLRQWDQLVDPAIVPWSEKVNTAQN